MTEQLTDIVTTAEGPVRGLWRPGSAAFLGMPFAEPPTGERAFMPPVPKASWTEVLDATSYGATAQRRPFGDVTAIPEPSVPGDSTLNINVFTPAPGDGSAQLPVLVWIHGGGYVAGSPASPWYDGFAFNRDGVVTVTLSYRLGLDGFGVIPGAPQNRGLLDQIEALRWVRRNIAAFGGDPDRVTIAGQSAGGGSVLALLHSPAARGLFHAAISHSGALRFRTASEGFEWTRALAEAVGVEPTLDGLRAADELALVDATFGLGGDPFALDAAELVSRAADGGGLLPLPFPPVQDEGTLPVPLAEAAAEGVGTDVPLLLGATAHEFTLMAPALEPALRDADVASLLRVSSLGVQADSYLAAREGLDAANLVAQLGTDTLFRVPAVQLATVRPAGTTWLYDFRLTHPMTGQSSHCADLPYAWDNLGAERVDATCGPDAPQNVADAMHSAWVQFITTHAAPWPAFAPNTESTMVFDREPHVESGYEIEQSLASPSK